MKKNLFIIFLLGFFMIIFLGVSNTKASNIDEFTPVAENKNLILLFSENSTEIAVIDKTSDKVWYSNPPQRDSREDIARGETKEKLNSQFEITYDEQTQRDNYNHSISYDLFETTALDEGIRVDYQIERMWRDKDYLPEMMDRKRFENLILDELSSENDREFSREQFNLVKLVERPEDEEILEISGLNEQSLLGDYKLVLMDEEFLEIKNEIEKLENNSGEDSSSEIKKLKSQLKSEKIDFIFHLITLIADNREDIEYDEDVRVDDLEALVDNPTYVKKNIPKFYEEDLIELFKEVGYTPEINREDYVDNNLHPPRPKPTVFEIPVEYRIEGEELVVRVPVSDIDFNQNYIDKQGNERRLVLRYIDLLTNFGAAYMDNEGYIFIPEGSGGLINFNATGKFTNSYLGHVYGRDLALDPPETKNINREQIHLPVYGLKQDDRAFLAIIEKGASIADIRVSRGGNNDSYYKVWPRFELTPMGITTLVPGDDYHSINIFQSDITRSDLQIRYVFLEGGQADYMGMAEYYRDYLRKNYNIEQQNESTELPFFAEIIGAVPVEMPFMGIPREVMYPLTTYQQVQTIIKELKEERIENVQLKYTGWQEGGLQHNFPDSVSLVSNLGTLEDFQSMGEQDQVGVFPDVGFLHIFNNTLFNGFSPKRMAAQYLNKTEVREYDYDLKTLNIERDQETPYVISPNYIGDTVDDFLVEYSEFETNNLSLAQMGEWLNSDFREENLVDRTLSKDIIVEQLEKLKGQKKQIMLSGGNAYTLPYADYVVEAPLTSSQLEIIDQEVPFYQIVLHGLIDYSGQPINLNSDPRQSFLKSIETGAGLNFKWSYEDTMTLKETEFSDLYSVYYPEHFQDAVKLYQEANEVLKHVNNSFIVGHQEVAEGVRKTDYENGYSIIVNYNGTTVSYQDIEIEGEDFELVEEERINEYH